MINANKSTVGVELAGGATDCEKLCAILLVIAGRDTNRMPSARRHVQSLDAALPFMSKPQAEIARSRIRHLETRWGSLLKGSPEEPESGEIPPEERLAKWLSLRRYPERYLSILHLAAVAIWNGERSLTWIQDRSYVGQSDCLMAFVGLTTFSEWLIQLRIGRRDGQGGYVPGAHCRWWVKDMSPAGGKDSAYAGCLKRLGYRSRQP